jgi:predicted nucleotidyltransferase component of viral defense system
MLNSKEELLQEARRLGYKPEILEKVYRLLDIFRQMLSIPYLKERVVLKGGTALNLFYFQQLPRLSVDIDLNYIGAIEREIMLSEKPVIMDTIHKLLVQNQFQYYRSPQHHAGGKMVWFYNSLLGQRSALEIDLNFMYRQPLYPIEYKLANIKSDSEWQAPVLNIHELAAGKLSALFGRTASRDLFDAHYLMTKTDLEVEKLREAFTIYLAMSKIDFVSLTPQMVEYNILDLRNRLLPVMHQTYFGKTLPQLKLWAVKITTELREALSNILPLRKNEMDFIKNIRSAGQIVPKLITSDKMLAEKILSHPALHWAIKQNNPT